MSQGQDAPVGHGASPGRRGHVSSGVDSDSAGDSARPGFVPHSVLYSLREPPVQTRPRCFTAGGDEPPISIFPSIEPPAPVSWRANPRRIRHQWRADRVRETPSWLLSLVTHMILLIMIGALAATSPRPTTWTPITLVLASPLTQDQTSSRQPTFFLADQQRNIGGEQGQHTRAADANPLNETTQDIWQPPPSVTQSMVDPIAIAIPDPPSVQHSVPSEAEHVAVRRQSDRQQPATAMSLTFASSPFDQPEFRLNRSLSQREMDGVVHRFIQYDIGRLRGAAGARARREFSRLGPEAIPALVRGLNRAAGYRASCPVGVISSRLNSVLPKTDDPAVIRYAIKNLGRGVEPGDPHYRRVRRVADQWRQELIRRYERLMIERIDEQRSREP